MREGTIKLTIIFIVILINNNMNFKIVDSFDSNEVGTSFCADVMPKMGNVMKRDGKFYKLLDIECVDAGMHTFSRGLVRRVNVKIK
jgi:hypothetical protein